MLGQGPSHALFDGYVQVEITDWEISVQTGGTYARLNGTVVCTSSHTGSFDGILEQVGAEWQLLHIKVEAPPEKINAYVMR